ncbi:larval cuticle protein A2B [Ceratitis capitata]|uniref:Pupal cuticle protein Edg-84A n=1 Tax=Ceratitis capitata TaxID=7213 RepID=W8BVC3_CERCA|nr:larval cuticle protein A2B [Ceratitis capitata]
MAFKYFTVALLITVVQAGLISVQEEHGIPLVHAQNHHESAAFYHAPAQIAHIAHAAAPHAVHLLHKQHSAHEQYPDDPHPQYNFAYNVQDALSGDSKSQSESRDGDVVHGEYSLNDADGFRRTVKYTADSVNGFNAVVEREPLTHKVVAAATPVQYHHAPSAVVAPVQYHHAPAPAAQAYAAVPVQHHQVAAHVSYEAPHQEEQHYYHH